MQQQPILAAVDLGSNSFRLEIGRVVGTQIYTLDSFREPVRLAASFSSIVFNAGSGTTVPGSAVCVVPAAGKARRHVVDDTGRVYPCPPVASNDVCERC